MSWVGENIGGGICSFSEINRERQIHREREIQILQTQGKSGWVVLAGRAVGKVECGIEQHRES